MEKILINLANKEVEVKTCGACIDTRGIMETDLVEGVKRGNMKQLATWVKKSVRVVSLI